MSQLPKVIATTAAQAAQPGETRGGVYLVDLQSGTAELAMDWNEAPADGNGRGQERGPRGVAFHDNDIYVAADERLCVFDRGFRLRRAFRNPFLRACHELAVGRGRVFIVSAGCDSILEFDIAASRFVRGYVVECPERPQPGHAGELPRTNTPIFRLFDPESSDHPAGSDTASLNSVCVQGDTLYVCGAHLECLLEIRGPNMAPYGAVPLWTHNARPFRGGLLFHSTRRGAVCWTQPDGAVRRAWPVVRSPAGSPGAEQDHASRGFGRGLCTSEDLIIAGSSPATVTAYRLESDEVVASVNLSTAETLRVHSLSIWPY